MIQQVRNKYLKDRLQTVVLDKKGIIHSSDDFLFKVDVGSNVIDLHPFFEAGFTDILKKNNYEETFYCVHFDIKDVAGSYDVYINSGNKEENPFLVFYDFTPRYAFYQSLAQEKNESLISFREETLNNHQLKIERSFKNKFLANISHDLQTPIASILGFLELLDNSQLDFVQKDILKTISLTSTHLSGLVSNLLDISKIETGKFKLKPKTFCFIDFQDQVEKIYLFKAASKNLDFSIEIDEKIPRFLIADRVRLLQIIVNTLDNAIKFTESGQVKITITENYRRVDNLGLRIEISDTGIGFSSRNAELAFESFKKLHKKEFSGLGLGLAIVQEIVSLMNGTVKLKSVLKKGTTIEINIPVKIDLEIAAKNKKIKIKEFSHLDFKNKYNVLIVDNDETNQLLLMKLLSNHGGFFVDISNNGEHALDLIEKNEYNLILMDVDMPIMNGITASSQIKKHSNKNIAKLPIIAISANPTADERKKCKEVGIKEYLPRPFTREELFLAIYKCLKNKKYS